ncbi:MAG: T9SS type A sorting domain-containing protein [Chitinophagales bacterium]
MKHQLYICIILLSCLYIAEAQNTFEKTYGSSAFEEAKSVRQTFDGGYIIGGTNLVKVDSLGIEEWTKPYLSSFANLTAEGEYILINSNNDINFTKVGTNGDILWQTNYSEGIWANSGNYIEQVQDGGYIVAGNFQSVAGSGMLLLKLNSEGNKVWRTTFSEPTSAGFSHGFAAQQTADNGYVIAGYTYIDYYEPTQHKDVIIVKTDSSGIEQWRKYFGGTMDDSASFIREDNEGNYFVGGNTNSYGDGTGENMYLIKLNASGDSLWTKTYGGDLEDTITGLWPTNNDGGCILVGDSNSFSATGDVDGYIIKIDGNGNTLWTKRYGESGTETLNSVQQTSDNGYAMAGYTNSIGAGDFDMLLLKTNSFGELVSNTIINENLIPTTKCTIYPNPNDGIFSIKSELNISKIALSNILGETIYLTTTNANEASFDLSQQSKGIYYYQIYATDNNLLKSGKIVFF